MPKVKVIADGTLIESTVCNRGDVIEVPQKLADYLIRSGGAAPASPQDAAEYASGLIPQHLTSELAGMPGDKELVAAGIKTRAELVALIKDKGDAWFRSIDGIGKATAAQIVEALTAAKPAAKEQPAKEKTADK